MRPDSRARWLLGFVAGGAAFAVPGFADDSRQWLERMNQALMTRSYVGDFFHVQEGRVESLRIIHRVEHGAVRERLLSRDGSGREFIRTGNELACYLPDKQTVLIERRPSEGSLIGNLPAFDHGESAYYEIRSLDRARIMGRDTQVIAVTPHDQYRYGYRLWIDESTAMPLKSQLCDDQGNVIEQIVFARISLTEKIPDSAFVPSVSTTGFHWLRHDARTAESDGGSPGPWEALRLPPGFHLAARAAQPMPGSSGPVTHLVFTDGLASVSVFVESAAAPAGLRGESLSRVGSSSAYSTVVDGHQVTAVGEVPPETVRYIASSVQQQSAGEEEAAGTLGPRGPGPVTGPDAGLGDAPAPTGFGWAPGRGPGNGSGVGAGAGAGTLSLYPGR